MRILYHHRIASKDGQYVHVEEIIKAMKSLGHEVVVVAPKLSEQQAFGGSGGIVEKLKQRLPKLVYEILELSYTVFVFFKLVLAILKYKPEFVYERYNINNPAGIWAKNVCKLPLILEINAPLYEERKKYQGLSLPFLAKWTECFTWQGADHVLPVSEVLANRVISVGVDKNKLTVIHNGVTQDFLSLPSDDEHTENLVVSSSPALDGIVIGFVGFCREWHALDRVVELLPIDGNEKLRLLIVGDGPERPNIEKRAIELGVRDRVHITGIVERTDIFAWIRRIDIALLSDAVEYASPLKLIEYMACGKCIVAPRQDNIEELLIDNQSVLLFKKDSSKDMLSAISKALSDDSLRVTLGLNARKAVLDKRLFWIENAKKIGEVASSIIETRYKK